MEELEIHILVDGSLGWIIESVMIEDDEHREEVRKAMKTAFEVVTTDGVAVFFSDENI